MSSDHGHLFADAHGFSCQVPSGGHQAVALEDGGDLFVLLAVGKQGRLTAGADRGIGEVERPLDQRRRETQRVEIGAEGRIDRLLAFRLGDIAGVEGIQNAESTSGMAFPRPEMQPAAPFCNDQSTRWSGPE